MLRDSIIAGIRTGVAFGVTYLITFFTAHGITLDPSASHGLNVFLFTLCVAVYNLLVNLLEKKVDPIFGFLLGIPKTPSYPAPSTVRRAHHNQVGAADLTLGAIVLIVVGIVLMLLPLGGALFTIGVILLVIGVVLVILGLVRGRGGTLH